jgi:hypothetical protein
MSDRRIRGNPFARWIAIVVAAAAGLAGCQRPQSAGMSTTSAPGVARYFFVVPQWLPNGESTGPQRQVLEKWLVERAGGFTRLGPARGGWQHGKDLIEEDAIAYFVVGPDGLRGEIEKTILERFRQRQAFVVQW